MLTQDEYEALAKLMDMIVSNIVKNPEKCHLAKFTLDITLLGLYNVGIGGDDECTDDALSVA